jgi:hypothetical protein
LLSPSALATLRREVDAMQYAILIHIDEQRWDSLPSAEREQVKADTDVLVADLVGTGKLKGAAILQGGYTARTLTRKPGSGQFLVMDGPFAETKEVLAGFQVVECDSLEEATAIAQRFPGLTLGMRLEIRPVGDNCAMLRTAAGTSKAAAH